MNLPLMGILLFIVVHSVLLSVVSASDDFETNEGCPPEQFQCEHRQVCIAMIWRCDGDFDCRGNDTSDEDNCEKKTCSEDEFSCNSGKCIPVRWQCDEEDDCGDASDEDDDVCRKKKCKKEEFSCGLGMCIPVGWRCDGHDDCANGIDEKNCTHTGCEGDEFACKSSGKCITSRWWCDKDVDCEDHSDEDNCDTTPCDADHFMCNSTKCIEKSWVCDGEPDCEDEGDEANCTTATTDEQQACWDTEFTCNQSKQCIPMAWQCDGDADCEDHSDEENCTYTCYDHQFKCGNNHCINKVLQCNGDVDCQDGSDEVNCSKTETGCNEHEFKCNNKMCIDHSLVCDKRNDCNSGEDEDIEICDKQIPNPCDKNNGGCLQECVHMYAENFYCDCFKGYKKTNSSCEDINECEVTDHHQRPCSQTCKNLKGSYKCLCMEGYTLEHDGSSKADWYCKADGERPWLLFANRIDVRKIQLDSKLMKPVVSALSSAIAVDFDYEDGTIFWSDVASEKILRRLEIDGTYVTEEVVSDFVLTPDGIAVDWAYKHLYWTDTGHNKIDVANLDGKYRKTLISENLDEPRAIVVDPKAGYFYWTDWGSNPKIERCGMNGDPTSRMTIIDGDVGWPNGLTIDYADEKLYWIDAKLHKIGSSKLTGQGRVDVLVDAQQITHPFSIAVFEDTLFWTDWASESIRSVHKFTGTGYDTVAIGLHAPMGIKIYHEYMQPKVTNHCGNKNGGCEHLCLPAPHEDSADSPRFSCACADGYRLHNSRCIFNELPVTVVPATNTKSQTNSPNDSKGSNRTNTNDVQPARTTENSNIDVQTAKGGYTIMPTNPTNGTKLHSKEEEDNGKVIGMTIGIVVGILVILCIVLIICYRRVKNKGIKSLNFDNPVYKKTTEEQFRIGHHSNQNKQVPSALQPLTAGDEVV